MGAIQHDILFVCTGNTCRSPMAEIIAKQWLAKYKGIKIDQLEEAGFRVRSAGVMSSGGSPASPEAIEAVKQAGLDLSAHRSNALTEALIQDADVIYTLTQGHRDALLQRTPTASDKTHRLDPEHDIIDPIGGPIAMYQQTAAMIREAIECRLKERYDSMP